ncbi:MAG TPA: PAS domain S-box protein [Opitutus sp.]|nr:PAS domain S-box protein [Opitutus sp.]
MSSRSIVFRAGAAARGRRGREASLGGSSGALRGPITRFALRVACAYVAVSVVWIVASDGLLSLWVTDPETHRRLATAKACAFIVLTGVMLFALVRRGVGRLEAAAGAQAEAMTALRQWADAFTHCAHGIAIGQPDVSRIIACNPAFAAMHGYTSDEIAGRPIPDFYVPAERETVEERLREADRLGRVSYESWRLRKDGTIFPVQMDVVSVRNAAGELLYRVATMQDITVRKAAQRASQQSEERFREVVENIKEVFWMASTAADRRILYVSPRYEEVWGRSRESLYAEPAKWLETIHPEDRARVGEAVAVKQVAGTYDEQFRIVLPDGSVRWVRDQAFPVTGPGGEVERIVGIAEDITEKKTLEEQFLRAQRLEAIGTLAGGVAHDLNNILAPVLMAAGLLKEGMSNPQQRDMLAMIERSARRGADIIRQLLTFSRGLGGSRGPIELRHLLKEVGTMVRETFPREIKLVEDAPRALWPVIADPTQLHQVLVNLCVNARDAMPEGGTLAIRAANLVVTAADLRENREGEPGNFVRLTVADTGSGIPAEIIERIFDPFFTTKDLGKGTGLGLSTVLGIVRSHGGFIRVQSTPGKGSEFQVDLPAATAEAGPTRNGTSAPFPRGDGETVLVVDDEEPVREATRHVLERHGYRVLVAANGKEAVTRFLQERDRVKLVLTDVMMPEMGGVALIRALRLIDARLKIVATSGLEPDGRSLELASLGVTDVLPKPCGPQVLLEAVRVALAPRASG